MSEFSPQRVVIIIFEQPRRQCGRTAGQHRAAACVGTGAVRDDSAIALKDPDILDPRAEFVGNDLREGGLETNVGDGFRLLRVTAPSLAPLGGPRPAGSFELFGDFVEPGLDARLVDAGRAGDADPGNDLVAEFNRQPTGNGDDVGQGYLLAHHRVVVGEALGISGRRSAKLRAV
jgi:hypothetical protein